MNGSSYLDNDKANLNSTSITLTGVNGKNLNVNNSQLANGSIYVPQIKSKNTGEFLGVLEWKVEDEPKIISKLIEGEYLADGSFYVGYTFFLIYLFHRVKAKISCYIPAWFASVCIIYVY